MTKGPWYELRVYIKPDEPFDEKLLNGIDLLEFAKDFGAALEKTTGQKNYNFANISLKQITSGRQA